MKSKNKAFTLMEVLFALFLVSIAVVVYYPQLKTAIQLQQKAYVEKIVLDDLENSLEYLQTKDTMDTSILSKGSTIQITHEDVGEFEQINITITNGDVSKNVSFYK